MSILDHRRLLARDPATTQAFLALIQRYVRRYFQRESQVHDVSHAAMLEMLDKLAQGAVPEPQRVRYWALNCASNSVRRELTRLRRKAIRYESRLHNRPSPDPSEVLEARQEIEHIDRLLADCTNTARRALEQRVRGQTHREIAKELEMGPGAVRMTISRLRAELSTRLTAEEKLERLRVLARRATPHGRSSLFRASADASS